MVFVGLPMLGGFAWACAEKATIHRKIGVVETILMTLAFGCFIPIMYLISFELASRATHFLVMVLVCWGGMVISFIPLASLLAWQDGVNKRYYEELHKSY